MKKQNMGDFLIIVLCVTGAFMSGGCKKSRSGGDGGGGGIPPSQQNPYSGDPGLLGGDWSGQNSTGGNFSFSVHNGIVDGYTLELISAAPS